MSTCARLLVVLACLLGLPVAAHADVCPACGGPGMQSVPCARCGGTGIEETVVVRGELGYYGCEACGGVRGHLDGTGRPGSGRVRSTCSVCGGTGQGPHASAARALYEEAVGHARRFDRTQDPADLEAAIGSASRAATADPEDAQIADYLRRLVALRDRMRADARAEAERDRMAADARRLEERRRAAERQAREVMQRVRDVSERLGALARDRPPDVPPPPATRIRWRRSSVETTPPAGGPVEIGVCAAVVGEVFATSPHAILPPRRLAPGSSVYFGDEVTTGPGGRVQVLLLDETVFTLGGDTEMLFDEFVYDPFDSAGKVAATVCKGIFRFVSGMVAERRPSAMQIKLPGGTIGIRGTDFTVNLEHPDDRWIEVHRGGVDFTHESTGKVWSIDAGQYLRYRADGSTPGLGPWPRASNPTPEDRLGAAYTPLGLWLRTLLAGLALCAAALGGVFLLRGAPGSSLAWIAWACALALFLLQFP